MLYHNKYERKVEYAILCCEGEVVELYVVLKIKNQGHLERYNILAYLLNEQGLASGISVVMFLKLALIKVPGYQLLSINFLINTP